MNTDELDRNIRAVAQELSEKSINVETQERKNTEADIEQVEAKIWFYLSKQLEELARRNQK